MNQVAPSGDVILVTGGNGFVGSNVVRMLVERGHNVSEIRIFDIREPTNSMMSSGSEVGRHVHIRYIQGDIRDLSAVRKALTGVTAVIHTASALDTRLTPDMDFLHDINVVGTENIIEACQEASIEYLIYTSTAEVYRGFTSRIDATEEQVNHNAITNPDDLVFHAYSTTKKLAEDAILSANGNRLPNGKTLYTISLRPCGIYGEGDINFVTAFLRNLEKIGFIPIIGGRDVKASKVYIGNIAWAHVHTLNVLRMRSHDVKSISAICGKAYHVTDDTSTEHTVMWAKPFLEAHRFKLLPLVVPLWLTYYIFMLMELIALVLSPIIHIPLPGNRNEIYMGCHTSTYDGNLAKSLLGYTPLFNAKEAHARSLRYYSKLKL